LADLISDPHLKDIDFLRQGAAPKRQAAARFRPERITRAEALAGS
jgi:hypothetical protein